VLYRLAKYGAPSALVGMPPRADWLVRPLLCLRATEVREYCRARGIAYGDDFTNAEEKYARNVVRLSALPQLERLNPRVVESLGAAAEAAREQQRLLTELVDEAWVRVVHDAPLAESEQQGTQPAVDLDALAREPEALRVLLLRRLAQAALGDDTLLQRRVTQALTALAAGRSGTRCVSLRGGWEAVREYRRLSLRRRPLPAQGRTAPSRCAPLTVKLPAPSCGEAASGATTGALSSSAVVTFCARRLLLLAQPGGRPSDAVGRAALGVDRLPAALTLRHPCTGDRFVPLGLAAETSVARFLREQKVALSARAHALVLEVEGQVAWVETPGVSPAGRVAHSFRVTESSVFSIFVREQAT
jgi:tRNA(Ile)-lysidine synthase